MKLLSSIYLTLLFVPSLLFSNPHDWPVHGHDSGHSFVNRKGNAINKNNVHQLVKIWEAAPGYFTVTPGDLVGVTHDPIVIDGVVYYGDFGQGILAARNAKNGNLIWEKQYQTGFLTGTILAILVHDDKIYFALTNTGEFRAVSRFDGSPIFTTSDFHVPDPNLPPNPSGVTVFASPIFVDNKVIFGNSAENERGNIVAIDAQTGQKIWQTMIAEPHEGSGAGIWASPAIDEARGLIFVGTANAGSEPIPALASSMLAIDITTGNTVWTTLVHPGQIWNQVTRIETYTTAIYHDISVASSPNLFSIGTQDVVGAFDKASQYTVFDRDTGVIVWKRDNLANGYIAGNHKTAYMKNSDLTGQEKQLYDDGIIYVIAQGTTEPLPQGPNTYFLAQDPAFIQAQIFITVYALNATNGSTIWQKQFDGIAGVSSGATVTKDLLFFADTFGDVRALDRTNGNLLHTFPRDPFLPLVVPQLQTQVSVSKGKLFIPGAQGLSDIQVYGHDDNEELTIQGNGKISLKNNAKIQINNGSKVGIRSNKSARKTDVTVSLHNNAQLIVGDTTNAGGALEVGNKKDHVKSEVSFRLKVNDSSSVTIGKQGFVGFGVGLTEKYSTIPNEWRATKLENVKNITIDVQGGSFNHSQSYSGDDENASLLAVGASQSSYFGYNSSSSINGGGNLILYETDLEMEPKVASFAGKTSKYYPNWKAAQLVKVNVLASKALLDSKSLQAPATAEDLFEYLKKETGTTITR